MVRPVTCEKWSIRTWCLRDWQGTANGADVDLHGLTLSHDPLFAFAKYHYQIITNYHWSPGWALPHVNQTHDRQWEYDVNLTCSCDQWAQLRCGKQLPLLHYLMRLLLCCQHVKLKHKRGRLLFSPGWRARVTETVSIVPDLPRAAAVFTCALYLLLISWDN